VIRLQVVCVYLLWSITAHAGGFQDAQNFALQHPTSSVVQKGAVTSSSVPGYTTSSPPQSSYQNNPNALTNASNTAVTNDSTGASKFVQGSAISRPKFNINGNTPIIKNSQGIQANAGALSGMSPSNTNGCQSVTTTTPAQYDTYTCTQSNTIISPSCNTSLSVTATTTSSCTQGSNLGKAVSITGIAGKYTYWNGTMSIQAKCGIANGYSDFYISLANPGGSCDNFKTYRNLGHLTFQITPTTPIGTEKLYAH